MIDGGRRCSGDRGDTLIEILIAIVVVGLLATGIVGAMIIATAGSGSHQDEALAQTLAVAAAEQVKSAPWKPCALASDYVTDAQGAFTPGAFPASWSASAITVGPSSSPIKYWVGVSSATPDGFTADSTQCIDSSLSSGGLQLITVQVTSPDQKATESVSFIKRNPT